MKTTSSSDVATAVKGELYGDPEAIVADVTHDSRQVRRGFAFIAVPGENVDGYRFVPQAEQAGASIIISEHPRPGDSTTSWIRVSDARASLAVAAAEVHRHPSRELQLVGITGTNGKTTTAYLVAAIAEAATGKAALLSTVEYRIARESVQAQHTTPEASDVQRHLRRAVAAGCTYAVMESSSQAIDLHRCDSLTYAVAVFTNLTRDHLDYHGTMENYYASKRKLFDGVTSDPPTTSIINVDDAYGVRLQQDLETLQRGILTFAIEKRADLTAKHIQYSMGGMQFRVETPEGAKQVVSPLVGRPHVFNLLSATATALSLGISLDTVVSTFKHCGGAPGRFERVPHAGDFAVVVDYAHTDDALLNVLGTARDVARDRVITIFGCGGERDRTKRKPMGEIAARLSDVVIVTSDNPRREDPEAILDDVEEGLRSVGKPYRRITDRREAIHHAVEQARDGDVVLIAGKGHEDYQILGTQRIHFDDREVAMEALASRGLAISADK